MVQYRKYSLIAVFHQFAVTYKLYVADLLRLQFGYTVLHNIESERTILTSVEK